MAEPLTYREAARKVKRSVRAIKRWRAQGMPMSWDIREGQRVRVVEERILLAWFRARLTAWPPHQYRLRKLRAQDDDTSDRNEP